MVSLEPLLKHMNALCCPEVLPQPTPEVRAIILETQLTMCPDFSGDKDMATRGAKKPQRFIW